MIVFFRRRLIQVPTESKIERQAAVNLEVVLEISAVLSIPLAKCSESKLFASRHNCYPQQSVCKRIAQLPGQQITARETIEDIESARKQWLLEVVFAKTSDKAGFE